MQPTAPAKAASTATAAICMPLDLPHQRPEEAKQAACHGHHLSQQQLRPGPLLPQRPSCCWPRRKWGSKFILHQSTVSAAPEQQASLHIGIQAVVTLFCGQLSLTALLGLIAAHCCPSCTLCFLAMLCRQLRPSLMGSDSIALMAPLGLAADLLTACADTLARLKRYQYLAACTWRHYRTGLDETCMLLPPLLLPRGWRGDGLSTQHT